MSERPEIPFHPVITRWFTRLFGSPTDVQLQAWTSIQAGSHALIAAPTGSGKTLAALLPGLDRIVRMKQAIAEGLSDQPFKSGVRLLYITPLKALNNDVHHHALDFVEQLEKTAGEEGRIWPGLSCEVRTGDTPASKRASMVRRPPDMLITTPESLFLLLTSMKGRAMLETVEYIVVDEIHDLAADKRGAHLSLSLERLTARCDRAPQRIGVSATQKPLERVARFLGGWEEALEEEVPFIPRRVAIVESAMSKRLQVSVTMPVQDIPTANREAVWKPLLDRIMRAMEGSRSVLIFVNSRRLCERLCLRLNDHVGYEMARSHHGSIARERRLEVERLMKEGSLRCIVATSSLELGIDIGSIDIVIQIDSPLEAARGIQRIGRAGHAVGEESRGLLIARHKALLPELAVLSRLISRREIEAIRIPEAPMDVLSQHTVAMTALDDWNVGDLLKLIRRSDSFRDYPETRLRLMLDVLSGYYPFFAPLLDWDRTNDRLTGRGNGRAAAVRGAGTIPQSGGYPVHHLESRIHLGELDEEFIQESRVGDVFQLGTSSWMIREIKNDRVYVAAAGNRFSEVPFWRNEAGGRSYELGEAIGAFHREVSERLRLDGQDKDTADIEAEDKVRDWLSSEHAMETEAATDLIALLRSQHHACGLPTDRQIMIEYYRDVMNQTHVILHNTLGKRVNRAWLLAIERQFEQRLPYRLYGNAKDNGIELVMPEWDASWLDCIYQVTTSNLELLLTEAITGSPLLAVAFRKIAETSLLLARSFTRTPMWQKRLRSEQLLQKAMPYAERFPYLREAMASCLYEDLGYTELYGVLLDIEQGRRELVVRETPFPSPFASQFMADYVNMKIYEGDGIDETMRMQLLQLSPALAADLFGSASAAGAVSDEALAEEGRRLAEPQRQPGRPDDLAALLKLRGDLTTYEIVKLTTSEADSVRWLAELKEQGKVVELDLAGDGELRWIRADETEVYRTFPAEEDSLVFVLSRYAAHLLSFTETDLCDRYPSLSLAAATAAVERLRELGVIVHAPHAAHEEERLWTSKEVATSLVRLSIRQARSQAAPAPAIRWCSQMAWQQHVLPDSQRTGEEGLLDAIERLQGLYLPLSHWETIIFPSRLPSYRKEDLDLLCAAGEVLWFGKREEGEKEGKVTFFLSGSKALYAPLLAAKPDQPCKHPQLLQLLTEGGASFLTRIARDLGTLPSEALDQLLDLVWEGRVSNDQFAPLRLHADPKSRSKSLSARAKSGSGLGRWYALQDLEEQLEPPIVKDPSFKDEESHSPVLKWIHHLLQTYGLINRDLVNRMAPLSWDAVYPALRQLEEWGIVTRGAFVQGMDELQFTTKEMGEAVKRPLPSQKDRVIVLSSADPANPFGMLMDWPSDYKGASFARKPGNFLVMQGERWLYWVENNGKRIYSLTSAPGTEAEADREGALLKAAFQTMIRRQKLVKLKVDLWDGQDAADSLAGQTMIKLGAERDRRSLVFWLN